MTAEQNYERDWGLCSICKHKRPSRELEAAEVPSVKQQGLMQGYRCRDRDWCKRQRPYVNGVRS